MKKIFTILSIVTMSAAVSAQTVFSATFDDVAGTGGNDTGWSGGIAGSGFTDGATSYTTGGAWTLTKAYKGNQCIKLGTSAAKGTITTPSIALTGSGTLSFRAGAWNGANENTTLSISATGATLSQPTVTLVKGAFSTYTVSITGATGAVTLTFEGSVVANNRFFIDDITVSTGSLAIADFAKVKSNFVKNTLVKNEEITFGADVKDVKIYNLSGRIVKTASVKENANLNVADLTKGNYIVTGTVNNQPVSQKILKD